VTLLLLAAVVAADPSAWTKVSPGARPLAVQISAEVAKAKASKLTPFVYIGASWCPPCVEIKRLQHHPKMVDAFRGTYIVELVVDDWETADLRALGYESRVIPIFHGVDARGRATGRSINGGAWGEDTPENMAAALKKFFGAR
jgi:thiol-disulfide isomerase/thioredoxin